MIVSTQATKRDIERGLELGANAFVPKPFEPELLRSTCKCLLAGASEHTGG
jgi:two-component system chemotaxis response regulator CheY